MSDVVAEVVTPPAPEDPRNDSTLAGIRDGALGQTWREYRNIVDSIARQRRIDDECAVQKQIETQQAETDLAREIEGNARAEFVRIDANYRLVADDKDRKPSSYSRTWGWMFVLLAFALVAADFPLTRQIVSAMSIGTDAVPTTEQVLVSIGIVAMSLFFKLLTDPFTQPQYLMTEKKRIVMQILSGLLALAMLGGVLAMLVLLGMFRASAINSSTNAGGATDTFSTTAPPDAGAQASAAPASNVIDSRLRDLERFRDQTFVIMGLILPIIGGIFASVGMARIHNAERLRHLEHERGQVWWILSDAARVAQTAAAAVRAFGHDLAAIRERETLAGGEYHRYLHAYQNAYCTPDRERGRAGTATRLRNMVEKWTAIADQSQNLVRTEAITADVLQTEATPRDTTRADQVPEKTETDDGL